MQQEHSAIQFIRIVVGLLVFIPCYTIGIFTMFTMIGCVWALWKAKRYRWAASCARASRSCGRYFFGQGQIAIHGDGADKDHWETYGVQLDAWARSVEDDAEMALAVDLIRHSNRDEPRRSIKVVIWEITDDASMELARRYSQGEQPAPPVLVEWVRSWCALREAHAMCMVDYEGGTVENALADLLADRLEIDEQSAHELVTMARKTI